MRRERRRGGERGIIILVAATDLILGIRERKGGEGKEAGKFCCASHSFRLWGEVAAAENRRNRTAVTGAKTTIGCRYRQQKEGS